MTLNVVQPYILEYAYIQTGFKHSAEFGCDVIGVVEQGQDAATVQMKARSIGGAVMLEDAANDLWEAYRDAVPSSSTCSQAVLWKTTETNGKRIFVSYVPLTTPNGGHIGPAVLSSQIIYTFRTATRGGWKITVEEGTDASNVQIILPPDNVLAAYVMGDTNIIMARDRSMPLAPLRISFGQNEKVWRARNR